MQKTLSEEVQQLEKTRDKLKDALEGANLNNEIISAIAKIYWLIYCMELRTDTYEEISSGEEIHRLTGKHDEPCDECDKVQQRGRQRLGELPGSFGKRGYGSLWIRL